MSPSGVTGPIAFRDALFDLGAQELVIINGIVGATERTEDRPDVIDAAEICVDRRRLGFGGLQHANQIVFGLGRLPQVFAQAVDVEFDAGDALKRRDDLFLELLDHVVDHVLGDLAVAHIGRMQHDGLALVLLAQQLEPLHEGEAAGVGEQQHVRIRQTACRWDRYCLWPSCRCRISHRCRHPRNGRFFRPRERRRPTGGAVRSESR